jgi:anti-anti-sigma factor
MNTGEVVAVALQPLVGETALSIAEKMDGEVAYVEAVGEIDLEGEETLCRAMERTLSQGARSVIFDLRRVSYMDTGALKILLEAKRRAMFCGGEIYVLVEDSLPRRVIYMAHLQRVLKVYRTVDEAFGDIARRATHRGPLEGESGQREDPERQSVPAPHVGA